MRRLALLALLVAAGCSKPGASLVGTWKGQFTVDRDRVSRAIASDRAPRNKADALEREYGSLQVELVLFAHGDYQMLLGPLRTKGSWTFKNGTLRLEPVYEEDADLTVLEGQPGEDGASLKLSDPSGQDLSVLELERQ